MQQETGELMDQNRKTAEKYSEKEGIQAVEGHKNKGFLGNRYNKCNVTFTKRSYVPLGCIIEA